MANKNLKTSIRKLFLDSEAYLDVDQTHKGKGETPPQVI